MHMASPGAPTGSWTRCGPHRGETSSSIGQQYRKLYKLRSIATDPLVHRHLRVCWENREPEGNCNTCYKCLFARLALADCGQLERFDTLRGVTILAADIDALPRGKQRMRSYNDLLRAGRLDPEVARAVSDLIQRTRRLERPDVRLRRAMVRKGAGVDEAADGLKPRKGMSFTTKSLLGLGLGLSVGLVANIWTAGPLAQAADWIEPAGLLWVKALRMLVIPLVLSKPHPRNRRYQRWAQRRQDRWPRVPPVHHLSADRHGVHARHRSRPARLHELRSHEPGRRRRTAGCRSHRRAAAVPDAMALRTDSEQPVRGRGRGCDPAAADLHGAVRIRALGRFRRAASRLPAGGAWDLRSDVRLPAPGFCGSRRTPCSC